MKKITGKRTAIKCAIWAGRETCFNLYTLRSIQTGHEAYWEKMTLISSEKDYCAVGNI